MLDFLFIVVGIYVVLSGADILVKGAAAMARRWQLPEMVIGLTIVAAGTSAPELFVSVMSALNHVPGMAVGNVVGSNIFNTLLIVGCCAVVCPITLNRHTVRRDMPFAVGATLLLILLVLAGGNTLTRIGGVMLLVAFALFMTYSLSGGKAANETPSSEKPMTWLRSTLFVAGGLLLLVAGSRTFVAHAASFAATLGMSDALIGLTIVAGGTSLPELATSLVAAKKGNSGIALGNVLGSNVFNILLILGLTSVITPLPMAGISMIDLTLMGISMLALWRFSATKLTVERWEGTTLLIVFIAYMTYLALR